MILDELNLSAVQKLTLFKALSQDDEIQTDVQTWFDSMLATSRLGILPRLAAIEDITGLSGIEDDERELSLPERIEALEHKTILVQVKPIEKKIDDTPIIPTTTLDLKAEAIAIHLQEEIKPNWGKEILMSTNDIYTFFKEKVTEGLRWKPDLRNPRQAKKDILERAVEMYPNILEIRKSKNGNKVTGIALKASVKCKYTDTC
jgi:hypothetical protein